MQASKCPEGTKPMLLFAGEAFDTDNEHKRLKSLLIGGYFVQTQPDVLFHTNSVNEADQRQTFLPPRQTFSEVQMCLRCVWPGWSMFCTSRH